MGYLTKKRYEELCKKNPYYKGRWEYLNAAAEMLQELKPERVLEIGPGPTYKPVLLSTAHTLDIAGKPTIKHNACKFPWPIQDDSYDVVVALQVWEHLEGAQIPAMAEVMRIAPKAILSFPYLWTKGTEIHLGIDSKVIARWTEQSAIQEKSSVHNDGKLRAVCLFSRKPVV